MLGCMYLDVQSNHREQLSQSSIWNHPNLGKYQDGLGHGSLKHVACLSQLDGKYLVVVVVNPRMTSFTRNTPHVKLIISVDKPTHKGPLIQSLIWNHPIWGNTKTV